MKLSLHARLIIAAAIVMVIFFGVTGWTLQSVYRADAETAVQDRLQSDAYALVAAAELDSEDILRLSYILPDARFFTTTSNVFAQITSNDKRQSWQSASMSRVSIPFMQVLTSGERRFERLTGSDGQPVYAFSLGIAWQGSNAQGAVSTVSVATSTRDLTRKIANYQRKLWLGLGGAALLLLIVQSLILRWGLAPLNRVALELHAIQRGEQRELGGNQPRELEMVTQNINALIRNRHDLLERYRNSLGDLAHSLKTPLAVLRGISETPDDANHMRETLREQVDLMTRIVSYQLQKAAASGSTALAAPVHIRAIVEKIVSTLNKVYADKPVICEVQIGDHLTFQAEEGDLFELLGNLLDNAYKWCRSRVTIHAETSGDELKLSVMDDGPGFPEEQIDRVPQRGLRADPSVAGHGIGLAAVRDLAKLYKGTLQIGRSSLGGAEIRVLLKNV